jgi:hypothetical protein
MAIVTTDKVVIYALDDGSPDGEFPAPDNGTRQYLIPVDEITGGLGAIGRESPAPWADPRRSCPRRVREPRRRCSGRRRNMAPIGRICAALTLCGLMALVPHSRAHALTLVPPAPPGATCQTTGTGIFCHGADTFSATNVDTGISCGTFELLVSFTATQTYELRYNSAGLGLEEVSHDNFPRTFVNSVSGKAIAGNEHFTDTTEWATPGDLSTGTDTFTGAISVATGQHFGLVSHDVGKVVFDPNGDIIFEGGPHDATEDFPGFVQAICAALA